MKIELTEQERDYLISALNAVPVRGIDAMVNVIRITKKLRRPDLDLPRQQPIVDQQEIQ